MFFRMSFFPFFEIMAIESSMFSFLYFINRNIYPGNIQNTFYGRDYIY